MRGRSIRKIDMKERKIRKGHGVRIYLKFLVVSSSDWKLFGARQEWENETD